MVMKAEESEEERFYRVGEQRDGTGERTGIGIDPSQYGAGWEQIDNVSFTHSLTCPSPWEERRERELPFWSSIHVTAVRALVIMNVLPPAARSKM